MNEKQVMLVENEPSIDELLFNLTEIQTQLFNVASRFKVETKTIIWKQLVEQHKIKKTDRIIVLNLLNKISQDLELHADRIQRAMNELVDLKYSDVTKVVRKVRRCKPNAKA